MRMEKMLDKIFVRTFWGIYNLVDRETTAKLSTYMYSKEADKKNKELNKIKINRITQTHTPIN